MKEIAGYTHPGELEWLTEKAKGMKTIVEIGSFMGRSTRALLEGCKGVVLAVDDFRGIPHEQCPLKDTELEAEFDKNLSGFKNLIKVKNNSLEAAETLGKADMVFIDGSHDYQSVKDDIQAWRPKTLKLLCGHDYENPDWPEVTQAVDEVFGKGKVNKHYYIWWVEMPCE